LADRQSFNYDSRLKNCCDEVVEMIPDGKGFDALAEVCEVACKLLLPAKFWISYSITETEKKKIEYTEQ
jgi:hypothetical protein